MIRPIKKFKIDGFSPFDYLDFEDQIALEDKLFEETGAELSDLTDGNGYFVIERLSDIQKDIVNKFLDELYQKECNKAKNMYNGDFTLENEEIRKDLKDFYRDGRTPTETSYYDEDNKLYMFNREHTFYEMIHDASNPLDIRSDHIEE